MNIEQYVKLVDKKLDLKNKVDQLEKEIRILINQENIETGNKVRDCLLSVFTFDELYWSKWRTENNFAGQYEEVKRKIRYDLDITRYVIDRYVNEFKGKSKLHRGAKHHIYLQVDYNLITQKFDTEIDISGLYSVLRDKALSNATRKMLNEVEKIFNAKSLNFEDLKPKFESVKKELDSWDGYYVTEELAQSK